MAVLRPRDTNVMIGAPTWSDDPGCTLTASSERSGFPVANLRVPGQHDVFESVGGFTEELSISLDRDDGAGFNAVSLLYSNLTADASWRIRYADTLAEVTSNPDHDTAPIGAAMHFGSAGTGLASVTVGAWTFNTCSLECWFRVKADVTNRGIMQRGTAAGSPGLWIDATRKLAFGSPTDPTDRVVGTTEIEAGTWYHVCGTYDNGTQELALIVNGVEENSVTAASAGLFAADSIVLAPLIFSRLHGDISNARFWSKVRSEADVLADKDTRLTGSEANLEAAWQADSATGTTIPDATSGSHDLVLSGDYSWTYPAPFWSVADYPPFLTRHSLYTVLPNGAHAKHMRIDILDPGNPDGVLRFGRLMVGAMFQPLMNAIYGAEPWQWRDSRALSRTTRGLSRLTAGALHRRSEFDLFLRELSDVAQWNELYAARGGSHDVLIAWMPTIDRATQGYLEQGLFAGVMSAQMGIRLPHFNVYTTRVTVEEL